MTRKELDEAYENARSAHAFLYESQQKASDMFLAGELDSDSYFANFREPLDEASAEVERLAGLYDVISAGNPVAETCQLSLI